MVVYNLPQCFSAFSKGRKTKTQFTMLLEMESNIIELLVMQLSPAPDIYDNVN